MRPFVFSWVVTGSRGGGILRTMVAASFVSLHLARFDELRVARAAEPGIRPGLLFCEVGADSRAAGSDPASGEAFIFMLIGLHDNRSSAEEAVADGLDITPWLGDAVERWSGVLAPFRTRGECNLLQPTTPARLFEPVLDAPDRGSPVVVLTTVGWNPEDLDVKRVVDFGAGVGAVRASMTAVPGLRSQQSFFFAGGITRDPMTLTFWDDEASLTSWAYRQPSHKRQMDRYRQTDNADRTSFTRLTALSSNGTWYGANPVAGLGVRTS